MAAEQIKVLVLFGQPEDTGRFDEYFETTHRQLLTALQGARRLVINRVADVAAGDLAYHLAVELEFREEEQMQSVLNSAAGQAMARDYPYFAAGGTEILLCRSSALRAGG